MSDMPLEAPEIICLGNRIKKAVFCVGGEVLIKQVAQFEVVDG